MELVKLRDAREPEVLCGICGQPAPGHADGLHAFTVDVPPVTDEAKRAAVETAIERADAPDPEP